MAVLIVADEAFLEHDPGGHHPERPARLAAVSRAVGHPRWEGAVLRRRPDPAPEASVLAVHAVELLRELEELDAGGGGRIDADTVLGSRSLAAARLAAGSGLTAIEALQAGLARSAFCAVRPPGHHARPAQAMGFCLLNNIAVAARHLTSLGERVAIVDIDAHHGNGTQDAFWSDPDVLFVSIHQWPLYPGTGSLRETGVGAGHGTTVNVPLPAGADGDDYRAAFDRVIGPAVERHGAAWLLVSLGFDGHRDDPLTDLGLVAEDFGALVGRLATLVPPSRLVAFLEGGYQLAALEASMAATMGGLLGEPNTTEPVSLRRRVGADGARSVLDAVVQLHGLAP